MLPQLLKPAGYSCGAIGKRHLGSALNFYPLQRGFDSFFGFLGGASQYFDAQLLRDETLVTESDYLTDAFTREAVAFINSHATQPFCLYLAYNASHEPYEAAQNYLDRVAYITDPDRRILAAMVLAIDDGVGSVLQTLRTNNLLNKTLIFFSVTTAARKSRLLVIIRCVATSSTPRKATYGCLSRCNGMGGCRHIPLMTSRSQATTLWRPLSPPPG